MSTFELNKLLIMPPCHTETPDFELHDDLKKTICLRAGGSLRLFVNVTGRPTPTITWSKAGVDLHNRGFIEVTSTSTTLIIDKVHRYDAGKYTLVAENSAGKQEVNILVKVYGKLVKTVLKEGLSQEEFLLFAHTLNIFF